mmetsp:Transcript_29317/g.75577  ORF Transcript_29317/g.75577 Transcript_29317/m.75577 type:complete len:113 (-) Transcript_29317:596-934(-)
MHPPSSSMSVAISLELLLIAKATATLPSLLTFTELEEKELTVDGGFEAAEQAGVELKGGGGRGSTLEVGEEERRLNTLTPAQISLEDEFFTVPASTKVLPSAEIAKEYAEKK